MCTDPKGGGIVDIEVGNTRLIGMWNVCKSFEEDLHFLIEGFKYLLAVHDWRNVLSAQMFH